MLVGLVTFVNGKPPPLEDEASAGKQQVTVKNELPDQSVKATEEAHGKETKVNVDISKVLKRDFKIHGVVAGDNFRRLIRLCPQRWSARIRLVWLVKRSTG